MCTCHASFSDNSHDRPSRIHTIHKRVERDRFSTFRTELIGLFILWLFWISGAAVASVRSQLITYTTHSHESYVNAVYMGRPLLLPELRGLPDTYGYPRLLVDGLASSLSHLRCELDVQLRQWRTA